MDASYTTAARGVLVSTVVLPYMTIDTSSSKPNSQASAKRPIDILYCKVTMVSNPVGLRQMRYAASQMRRNIKGSDYWTTVSCSHGFSVLKFLLLVMFSNHKKTSYPQNSCTDVT